MSLQTVYLVTGANRGLGLGLVKALLIRPNAIVIATIRSCKTSTSDLESLPSHESSRLEIYPLANDDDNGPTRLMQTLQSIGIKRLDTIIANAGSGTSFNSVLSSELKDLREAFEINCLGPFKLFKAAHPLLADSSHPKFILISSSLASTAEASKEGFGVSYGVSKCAANHVVRRIHCESEEIVTLCVHPGWVKTGNGQAYADALAIDKFPEPPLEVEDVVPGILKQIDIATKETTSGSFVQYDGTPLAW